jgi:flagellar motor switch protein FliM
VEFFESFTTELGRNISSLLIDAPYCKLDGVEPALLPDVLSVSRASRIGTLHAAEIDARAFVVFDGAFDWVMIDQAFGAGSSSVGRAQASTTVRRTRAGDRFLSEIARMAAQALGAAFSKIHPLSFSLERMLDDKSFALEGHQAPLIAAKLTVRTNSRDCRIALLMPHSILGQMRNALAEPRSKAIYDADPVWSREFETAVSQTPLRLSAVVEDLELTLGQVANLKVGQALPLRGAGVGRVRLVCNGQELFLCRISQSNERYVLEIE